MAWHISNKLYEKWRSSQALEVASLEESSSDGNASAQSSGSHTPLLYLPPDRMKAFSRLSRYGMTFRPLTDDHGAALLTWYREAFRARTSAPPERAQASPGSDPGCGNTWRGSLARYDPDTCSWRTVQYSLLGDLTLFSQTWPRWGTMRNGECSERTMPALPTRETGYGSWPTPVKTDGFAVGWCLTSIQRKEKGEGRPSGAKIGSGLRYFRKTALYLTDGYPNPALTEWLMGWPHSWTDLQPQETVKFHRSWPWHSAFFANGCQSA